MIFFLFFFMCYKYDIWCMDCALYLHNKIPFESEPHVSACV